MKKHFSSIRGFSNKSFEVLFNDEKLDFHVMCLKTLCMTLVTQSTAIYIINPLNLDLFNKEYLSLFVAAMMGVLGIFYIFTKKLRKYSPHAITTLVISFIIGASEISKIIVLDVDWNAGIYLLMGMSFETGCLFLIISRIAWIQNSLVLLGLQTYIWLRAIDHDKNPSVLKPALITLIIYGFILPLFCYSGERVDREVFLRAKLLQEQLRSFESLIKNVIPSSIIIFTEGKLVFFNQKTHDILLTKGEDDLLAVLKRLVVLSKKINFFKLRKNLVN